MNSNYQGDDSLTKENREEKHKHNLVGLQYSTNGQGYTQKCIDCEVIRNCKTDE